MSFSANIILSAMGAVKKTGIIKGPGMDADINLRRAREYNRKHPYKEPSDRKAAYKTIYAGGYPCLVIRQRQTPLSGKAILFLHGGGDTDAWKPDRNDAASCVGLCVQSPAAVSCAGTVQHSGRGKYCRRSDVPWFVHPVFDFMIISEYLFRRQ